MMQLPERVNLSKVKELEKNTICPRCGKTECTIFNFGTEIHCRDCRYVGPLPNKEELL